MHRAPFVSIAFAIAAISPAQAQDDAEAAPWSLGAVYTGEWWQLDRGDAGRSSHYLDNLDLTASVDADKMFGVRGVKLFAYGLYNNGQLVSDGTDSVHGVSNIEATHAWRLYEAWAEWQFASAASVRAGLYDLNSEFDAMATAGLFVNPSHGIGPDFSQTGLNGPSIFPITSVGMRLQAELGRWQARVAVLDAVPGDLDHSDRTVVQLSSEEGVLYASEINYSLSNGARTGLGYWHYSESFDAIVSVNEAGEPIACDNNQGTYAFAETAPLVFANGGGTIRAFTRTGWADENVNPVSRYVGAGITLSDFISDREDQLGLAVAHATMGAPWRQSLRNAGIETSSVETAIELTARFAIGSLLTLQPDVQYLQHPGAVDERGSIWAFGLRFEVGLTREP
jgi:porin